MNRKLSYEEKRELRRDELKAQATATARETAGLPPPSRGRVREIMEQRKKVRGEDGKQKLLQIEVPEAFHTQVRVAAAKTGGTIKSIVFPAIEQYLRKMDG